jgi:hypothetical protein
VLPNSNAITNSLLNYQRSASAAGPYHAGVGVDTGTKFNIVHGNAVTWTPVQDWHEYGGDYTTAVSIPIPSSVVVCGEDYGQPSSHYNIGALNHMVMARCFRETDQ